MARRKSYKKKMIVSAAILVIAYGILFGYAFPYLDGENQQYLDKISEKKTEFQNLQSEKKSFELGQRDLKSINSKAYQPKDLFNTDKFLVEAVKKLEDSAQLSDVTFSLQVAGKGDPVATKAQKTASGLVVVPYNMEVKGSFGGVVAFLERIENMPFVTHGLSVNVTAQPNDQVSALVRAQFFIQK